MEKKIMVQAECVSKVFQLYEQRNQRILELIGKKTSHDFYALRGVSFTAYEGESIGLIGLNGSGKSTLTNIIAGISSPTDGKIDLAGVPALISVSHGMNGKLTGRENIHYKGLLMGMADDQIREMSEKIIEFADIGAFIDQPFKTYSSGMKSRLGFAISINIDPDILIVDEALSVGDPSFTQKCLDKMHAFCDNNKTIFFVSHSMPQMREFCQKVIWLEYGVMKAFGPTDEVLPQYERFLKRYNQMTPEEKAEYKKYDIENQTHLLIG